jgi:hypothetical protein
MRELAGTVSQADSSGNRIDVDGASVVRSLPVAHGVYFFATTGSKMAEACA